MIIDILGMSFALMLITFIALIYIGMAENYHKRLHAYRKKYGFDRTLEIADLDKKTISNIVKTTKILDRRQRTFGKNVNAEIPKQDNETIFQFIKRRCYKV